MTHVTVSEDGLDLHGRERVSHFPVAAPAGGGLVAPLWDDFSVPAAGAGRVRLLETADKLTVRWENVTHVPSGRTCTFAATVQKSARTVTYAYTAVPGACDQCEPPVVGLSAPNGAFKSLGADLAAEGTRATISAEGGTESSNAGGGEGPAAICEESCAYSADGDCDDGGPGSTLPSALGVGLPDCGARDATVLCEQSCAYADDVEGRRRPRLRLRGVLLGHGPPGLRRQAVACGGESFDGGAYDDGSAEGAIADPAAALAQAGVLYNVSCDERTTVFRVSAYLPDSQAPATIVLSGVDAASGAELHSARRELGTSEGGGWVVVPVEWAFTRPFLLTVSLPRVPYDANASISERVAARMFALRDSTWAAWPTLAQPPDSPHPARLAWMLRADFAPPLPPAGRRG